MNKFELVEPFETDNGSLADLAPEVCFALGVEWATFRQRIIAGERFTDLCLSANAPRLVALAERHGRFVEHHHECDGWSKIFVGSTSYPSDEPECPSDEPESR
jgi:hypothetical protein